LKNETTGSFHYLLLELLLEVNDEMGQLFFAGDHSVLVAI